MRRGLIDQSAVLITGASSGIGAALARLLAPRVKTLALVARRLERLEALKKELVDGHPALQVALYRCDLSDLDAAAKLATQVESDLGTIDILINNAGGGDFALFDRSNWSRIHQMLQVNMGAPALLTHHFVRPMVARGRGGILNISSGFGISVLPGFAGYVGCKHFVTGFTESLRLDLSGTGVTVTQVCPGPVRTEFASNVGAGDLVSFVPSFVQISAERCARAALRGLERGSAMVVPGLLMKLARFLVAVSPRFLQQIVLGPLGRLMRRKVPAQTAKAA